MAPQHEGDNGDLLRALLCAGTAAGLTDGQLLERFATRAGEASELAFAALVARHGPMVLRTCRAVLGDAHDAEDACQATFLILARQGASLWVRDSVGPWLHRVACRAAARARRAALRRQVVEQRAAALAMVCVTDADGPDDLTGLVHEEVDRLPERFRVPIVLCDLEGRTHEEAARHLGCPVGTVKSRLARGRARLHARLSRRGVAPTVIAPWLALAGRGVPPALDVSVVKSIAACSAPAAVAALAQGVLRGMFLTHLRATSLRVAGVVLALGLVATAGSQAQQSAPKAPPAAKTEKAEKAPAEVDTYAWRRTDVYEPPDFARFFPDDPAGGRKLDALWNDQERQKRPAAEVLATVRQGLRRTTADREDILKWVGSAYVWHGTPQDPNAMEILYHAADFRGPFTSFAESLSIYYGFMRVEPKPPAVLHAMVDWCMHVDNGMDWYWVSWCGKGRRAEMASYVKPYLTSPDEATRDRAAAVEKLVSEEPNRSTAYIDWITKATRKKSGHLLPQVKQALLRGDSAARGDALRLIGKERLGLIMDDTFADPFRACARDKDAAVRREVAQTLPSCRLGKGDVQSPEAIDVLLGLSKDDDSKVRYDAVYYGLTPLPQVRREDVAQRLVDMVLFDQQLSLSGRVAWGLQHERDLAARYLDEHLRSGDPARVEAARAAYKELAGRSAPNLGTSDAETRRGYVRAFRELYEHLGKVYPNFALKGIDWAKAGDELLPRVERAETEEQFGRLVLELVARLEDSHAVVTQGSATPPWPVSAEWDPWLACLTDDRGRPVVYAVSPATDAWRAGVRPGMTVVSVNGVPAEEAIARWMREQRQYVGYSSERYLRYDAVRLFHRQAERGAKVSLVLEDPDGRRKTVDLKAEGRGWYIPRLPVPRDGVEDGGADVQWMRLKNGPGYLQVRRMRQGLEVSLDQAIASLGNIKGLILDVRGNSGGGFDAATAFQNFDPSVDSKRPRFKGPIALLIDERCISAGEGWASWFVAKKRARTFGTTTAGASSRKAAYTLTNGLYKVEVPVKAYTGFLDRPIERRGLEPDVEVRCSAVDIANGRDTVAEAATEWLLQAK